MNWDKVWTANNLERMLVGDLFTQGHAGGLLLTVWIAGIAAGAFGLLLLLSRLNGRRSLRRRR